MERRSEYIDFFPLGFLKSLRSFFLLDIDGKPIPKDIGGIIFGGFRDGLPGPGLGEGERLGDRLGLIEIEALGDIDGESDGLMLGDMLGLAEGDMLGLNDGDMDRLGDRLGLMEAEADKDGDTDTLWLIEADG